MAAVGLFGGTFNPVHNGHIHLAKEAFSTLKLEKLIFIPANIPPHKKTYDLCSNSDRLQMCMLAVEGIKDFEVSDFDMMQGGKSYTYYTVEYFSGLYQNDELYLLVGSDMFMIFDSWFRFEDILKKVSLAVVSREYDDMDMLERKAHELQKYGKIRIIDAEAYPLSSTDIRSIIKENKNYSCYLPEKVVQYIRFNNLYR